MISRGIGVKKNFIAPFYGWSLTSSRLESLREGSLRFTTSSQKFLVLILSTLEGWKAESILEPPSRFEHETSGLGIQRLNHLAIAPLQLINSLEFELLQLINSLKFELYLKRNLATIRLAENKTKNLL